MKKISCLCEEISVGHHHATSDKKMREKRIGRSLIRQAAGLAGTTARSLPAIFQVSAILILAFV
ncbi:hypothetical protein [Acetobacter oeni]|uniref:Uncharacterized protein n=1 Tax=Acetobacter oeni TaxID=304077 RepID=A0A511XQQ9_9PROT|nr:hypothetical protein [Acetobacter oeni]MBB3884862.1 hypothetical protein [Acetobacter oeni]NHO20720.1 hypothetical protein [Acetobacter oeni]GBR09161.1 hypothetical protein AA21952_2778 [Acetobacter oeni LMG 21952]GEN65275.1 hypothetical protein AOE01nite_34990 [Acetobacter oeni]